MSIEYDLINKPVPSFSWKPEEKMRRFLQEKNDEGWELVSIAHLFFNKTTYVFKRERKQVKTIPGLSTFPNPGF